MKKVVASAVLAASLACASAGSASAGDCRSIDPQKERTALSAYLKRNGYSPQQISFSLRYADGKVRAWRKLPLTERGRQCGVAHIGGMIYGCMVDGLPPLVEGRRNALDREITDPKFLKEIGVKRLTVGESLAVAAASMCQAGAIEAFADPRSW